MGRRANGASQGPTQATTTTGGQRLQQKTNRNSGMPLRGDLHTFQKVRKPKSHIGEALHRHKSAHRGTPLHQTVQHPPCNPSPNATCGMQDSIQHHCSSTPNITTYYTQHMHKLPTCDARSIIHLHASILHATTQQQAVHPPFTLQLHICTCFCSAEVIIQPSTSADTNHWLDTTITEQPGNHCLL